MYPYISLDDIDPTDPKALQKLHQYYQVQIDSLSFVLDQASELIESETLRDDDSNISIALNMLDSIAKRMDVLISKTN